MENQQKEIRIYVACLASYNSGILHGAWIDADQHASAIRAEIRAMLKASSEAQAEEWAIHDYEGFEGAEVREYAGIDSVAEIAAFIAEPGALGGKIMAHYNNLENARDTLENHYAGEYKSLTEFAQEITEETTQIPESLQFYIDYETMARDLEINDVFTIETSFEEIHVFWNH